MRVPDWFITTIEIKGEDDWWNNFKNDEQIQKGQLESLMYLLEIGKDYKDSRALRLARDIIKRESGWRWWKCNETTEYGCDAGQGLFMVIPSTELTCEEHFDRKMNMLNPKDNIDCGWWLLTERGIEKGIGHWDDMSWKKGLTKKWGSGKYDLNSYGEAKNK